MNENDVKKDLYKSKNMAKFSHYVSGNLYYRVELADGVYQFPIAIVDYNINEYNIKLNDNLNIIGVDKIKENEITHFKLEEVELSSDLGQTRFEAEIKGSDLNRWISKAIKKDEFIKVA